MNPTIEICGKLKADKVNMNQWNIISVCDENIQMNTKINSFSYLWSHTHNGINDDARDTNKAHKTMGKYDSMYDKTKFQSIYIR